MNAFICLLSSLALALSAGFAVADDITGIAIPNQPKVPGVLRLHVRERQEVEPKSGEFEVIEGDIEWNASETAIIVCDMWEDHPCKMSAHRVDVMAPEMNRVISVARSLGVTIIHSPSSGMEHYEKTPQRRRIKAAPEVKSPVPIEGWCYLDPEREAEYPIPYSHSVVDACDDPIYAGDEKTSRRQHPAIKIVGYDGISDNGVEIYNFIEQQGIKNVVLMGVHTHYCVLGRSFGIRQMVRLGKNVVLARDLTDAMYDPRKPPYVSHARGTELAVEHIEKYWCPSILGSDLTEVIPGSADVKEPNTATNDE
ncbi:MAG: cysteine hydrolase family protein [Planctomycetota bacterium]|nr:cysteine hydrolase family protein [Planctomycetota bacterium]MDA1213938.1 cysteine hydrolase family protein [Planctomycetota bacterium]